MNLTPIGAVHAPVEAQTDEHWGDVISEIHLEPPLAVGLLGIEHFSHAIIIFLTLRG